MTLIWENSYFELGTERIFVNTTLLALDNSFCTICFGEISPVHSTPEKFQNGRFTVKTYQMFSVHTTPEEFQNGGFTLKTRQIFSVHTTPEKSFWKRWFHYKNASNLFRPHYAGRIWKQRFPLKTHQMFSVHTTPEEFENGDFTLKTHQMFSVHTMLKKFKITTTTGDFGFAFDEN